jgi:hypothetical protein
MNLMTEYVVAARQADIERAVAGRHEPVRTTRRGHLRVRLGLGLVAIGARIAGEPRPDPRPASVTA